MKTQGSSRYVYIAILTLAALASLVSIIIRLKHPELHGDEGSYDRLAVTLVRSHKYGTESHRFDSLMRQPLYPFFVALVYSMAGIRQTPVYIVQGILFLCTLVLVHRIALYITKNKNISLLTMLACSLCPIFLEKVSELLSETLTSFLVACTIWGLIRTVESSLPIRSTVTGILIGLTSLVKAAFIPFVLPAALIVYAKERHLKCTTTLVLAVILTVAPWTIRNYVKTGYFIPISIGSGLTFWMGNWEGMYTRVWSLMDFPPEVQQQLAGKNEVEMDRTLMRIGLSYVKQSPALAIRHLCLRFTQLTIGGIGIDPRSVASPIPHIGRFGIPKMTILYLPLTIFCIMGWFMLDAESKRRSLPMVYLLFTWVLVYTAIYTERRYMIPVDFYRIMLAVIGINGLLHHHSKPRQEIQNS